MKDLESKISAYYASNKVLKPIIVNADVVDNVKTNKK